MMTGMRKRVTIGFLSTVILLFFSGMLSLFELRELSRGTDEILRANQRNIELAKEMLDAAHDQNMAFIRLSIFREAKYDSLCRASLERLEQTLAIAQEEAVEKSFLDSLSIATTELRLLTDRFLADFTQQQLHERNLADSLAMLARDSLDSLLVVAPAPTVADFVEQERHDAIYTRLTGAIRTYMTSTQSSLAPRTEQMKKNAYRAVMPVLVSLVVMIAIVLMLYYFTLLYCVNPILKIDRSLGDYLQFRIPYRPKSSDFQDELSALSEKIENLISFSKQSTPKS